jgi:hypothetical protein
MQGALVDEPARKVKGGTAWQSAVDKEAVKAAGRRIRHGR